MSSWRALQSLLDDPTVDEIMVNGPAAVWVERNGVLAKSDVTLDERGIEAVIERLLAPTGRRVDRRAPCADARLADGSRVNVVVPPAAVDGPYVTIRRFGSAPRSLDAFASPMVASLLRWLVESRANLLVTGAAGAGKTTLLNALARFVAADERVVTIEDAAELRLEAEHVVRLEARPPNAEGAGGVSVRELLRNALRMRPDRLVVGEVRGNEAVEMVQAMSTGHDGSLSTCHANSPLDALRRLETMIVVADTGLSAAAVREQLGAALDVVVHVARAVDGTRRVVQVAEVDPGPPLTVHPLADGDDVLAPPRRAPRRVDAASPDAPWAA
jgi:pilus assembly protein CpaF